MTLEKRANGEWIKLDSAVIAEGTATFSGEILDPEMYFLNLEDVRAAYGFFAEPAEITVKLDAQNTRESITTGSATQDRYMAFYRNMMFIATNCVNLARLTVRRI